MVPSNSPISRNTLSVFRIALSSTLLVDLILRARYLTAHYTDQGVFPRRAFLQISSSWSVHLAGGSPTAQGILFFTAGLFAILLALNIRPRLMCCLSWLMLVSLHHRNPYLLQGGDTLLKLMVFWSCFLPFRKSFSTRFSLGPYAFMLQIALMYFFAALHKINDTWILGDAVHYALNLDQMTSPYGVWLRKFPELLRYFTWATFGLELFAPVFLLSPFPRARGMAALALICMHLSFIVLMSLGLFPIIDIVALIIFIPGSWLALLLPTRSIPLEADTFPIESSCSDKVTWTTQQALCSVALFCMMTINLRNLNSSYPRLPGFLESVADLFELRQRWSMFREPSRNDGWFIAEGKRSDGTAVDVWRLKPEAPSRSKPAYVPDQYVTYRWRKYFTAIKGKGRATLRSYFGKWLCRRWTNESGEEKLEEITVTFLREKTLSSDDPREPQIKPIVVLKTSCNSQ